MKILFDAAQPYQLDAINAVVNVFAGQPRTDGITSRMDSPFDMGGLWSEMGVGNGLQLGDAALLENVRAVQVANDLPMSDALALLGTTGVLIDDMAYAETLSPTLPPQGEGAGQCLPQLRHRNGNRHRQAVRLSAHGV